MSGIPEATAIILTEAEHTELEGLARSSKTEYRLRQRARIVLLAADGMASRAIGRTVRCTTGTASKWRVRYAEKRLAGLDETGDRGAEPKYTAATGKRILALLDQPQPAGYARWSGPLLAAALGDVDVQYVWRFLRGQKIDLAGRKSWCESDDPEFVAKAGVSGISCARPFFVIGRRTFRRTRWRIGSWPRTIRAAAVSIRQPRCSKPSIAASSPHRHSGSAL